MSRSCALLLLTILFTVTTVTAARAAPTKLSQQGRLLDGDGEPLTGTHALIFSIYDAETGGNEVWREERSVDFEVGYYQVALGELVPVDDLVFSAGAVWLELTVNGAVLSPRHEIVSVPYALRSSVAEAVEGGPVDADEISVGGNPVIDSSGNWVGPAVDWSELTGVPSDLSDGDADTDTLLGLPCADGFIAKFSAGLGAWDCAPDDDVLGGLSCQTGDIPVYEASAGVWLCGADLDTDTQLTAAEVAAAALAQGFVAGAHTVDTNTQLTEAEVAAAALAQGFVAGAHTVDTNTQLTEAEVAAAALAQGFVAGAHTVDTDTQLTEAEVDAFVANNGYSIPSGGIIMWSGSTDNIPDGWALCDGSNGTPDLLNRFIKSVDSASTNPGLTGGSASVHIAVPRNIVTWDVSSSSHQGGYSNHPAGASTYAGTQTRGSNSHFAANPNASGFSLYAGQGGNSNSYAHYTAQATLKTNGVTISNVNNEPEFYALAFIMKL